MKDVPDPKKLPWLKFWVVDWLNEPSLRFCSRGARSLWMDMLCLMHMATPYGHLTRNGVAVDANGLAKLVGDRLEEVTPLLEELEREKVFSKDAEGRIFSRRMVKEDHIRQVRSDAGRLGGNPMLGVSQKRPGYVYLMSRASDGATKIGCSRSPKRRLFEIRAAHKGDTITLLGRARVQEMVSVEEGFHKKYSRYHKNGDWFLLREEHVRELLDLLIKLDAETKTALKKK